MQGTALDYISVFRKKWNTKQQDLNLILKITCEKSTGNKYTKILAVFSM